MIKKVLFNAMALTLSAMVFADQKTTLDRLSEAIGRGDQKLFQESLSKLTDVNLGIQSPTGNAVNTCSVQ